MTLIGNRYIQASDSDPGAVGFGYEWLKSDTGDLVERNSTNTGWVFQRNVDLRFGGNISKRGGVVTGNIIGATGWAASDNHNFATSLQVGGHDVATESYLTTQLAALDALIASRVSQSVSGYITSVSALGHVAVSSGRLTGTDHIFEIPLPKYIVNGIQETAEESQCQWIVFPP